MSEPTSFRVLHVCTGNICRSPMAELLMKAALSGRYGAAAARVTVGGGGTYAGHAGEPINPPAGAALTTYGIDASGFRSRPLTREGIVAAGLVLCASREHVHRVVTVVPEARDRTFLLLDVADLARRTEADLPTGEDPVARLNGLRELAAERIGPPTADGDIDDPYGRSPQVYAQTAAVIRSSVHYVVGAPLG